MLDISLLEESMMQTPATVMAVCVLQASRIVTGLPWSRDLVSSVLSSSTPSTYYNINIISTILKYIKSGAGRLLGPRPLPHGLPGEPPQAAGGRGGDH